tara:strand:+ start:10578 stop:11045 length:468 start_codon:yes stop_codon:yes gene_type:complete
MRLKSVLQEASYSAWRMPDSKNLKQEYNVEYKHHVRDQIGDIWPTYNDFVDDVKKAKKTKVSKSMDRSISNRSRTQSKEQLIRLVKGYASWPEFRNEKSIDKLYSRIENNESLDMPLVLKTNNGLQVMAGNTRMDVAFQQGVSPTVLVIDVSDKT